ncbi:uncharacterized protein (DUF924 family) [Hoeflea marina]|uniref:Uncharacterized protein (DUF924 family) n=1 Tax=Hoeflea marina TaxID=274592 RepID=A0A317PGF1_9HYPH|nr:DUF924 family protein [Hoeflea marina]PWV99026.1 uncharacterized protein (DUF924 family) [Hoeflea marina]
MTENIESVLEFWFDRLTPEDWFVKKEAIDQEMIRRFSGLHVMLSREISDDWRADPEARLALIIVLDQFPRNIFRGSPHAFATDGLALREAKAAIAAGADQAVPDERRFIFYMPFEHAEDMAEQDRAVELFTALGNANYLDYAVRHRDVIARFGRFPHRNPILGRESTAAEAEYLAQPGAGF